jgi:hypothetical protein
MAPTLPRQRSSYDVTTDGKKVPRFVTWFMQWLATKDRGAVLDKRQEELRGWLVAEVEKRGEPDEKGHIWLPLPEVITFKDHEGEVTRYSVLKRERHLTPAEPKPDPKKTLVYLQKHGMWLTPEQEAMLAQLQMALPWVKIKVEVDSNAIAQLYYSNRMTERVYSSLLVEQKESFQFRPGVD